MLHLAAKEAGTTEQSSDTTGQTSTSSRKRTSSLISPVVRLHVDHLRLALILAVVIGVLLLWRRMPAAALVIVLSLVVSPLIVVVVVALEHGEAY